METIEVHDLQERTNEILRRVKEEGDSFEVTDHGQVVARLVPASRAKTKASLSTFWKNWDEVSRAVSDRWPDGIDAARAIREERRDLESS